MRAVTIDVSVLSDPAALRALEAEWRVLADDGAGGGFFRGPDWLLPWWHAYHQMLGAQPHVLVARDDGALVGLAPLYARTIKVALLDVREIRMMGDAGPRPPALDLLAAPGAEDRVAAAMARTLLATGADWDVLDLDAMADPSRVRATLVSRLASAGLAVESAPSAGGARRIAVGLAPPLGEGALVTVVTSEGGHDLAAVRKGLSALRRLSRLEWAERDEASPLADGQAAQLLEEVAISAATAGRGRVVHLDEAAGEPIAAALIVDDGERAVVLAMAADPLAAGRGAAQRLLQSEAAAAAARGRRALDVAGLGDDYELPLLPVSRQHALSVRIWSGSTTAAVGRAYRGVQRRAKRAATSPGIAAAQARAAWTRIRTAAANMAAYDRMCLVRGQLWTRGVPAPPGLDVVWLTAAGYDQLDDVGRADLIEQLGLDDAVVRRTWDRGDLCALARLAGRPAGIAWSAGRSVEVAELGRSLHLGRHETLIHDVYVAPAARGRGVAPVMLEFLARELRGRDIYRSWALIDSENQASLRAFQKASYTPVCDVIYARMATVDRILVRPPDPEARELLGL